MSKAKKLRRRCAKLEGERDYHRAAHDSATTRIALLTKDITELEAELDEVTDERNDARRTLAARNKENDRMYEELEQVRAERDKLKANATTGKAT